MEQIVPRSGSMAQPVRFALSIQLTPEGDPPTEFRIFRQGRNDTAYGPVVFDGQAAETVLARYAERGDQVDLMIDLEHDSVDKRARTRRDDAADARGWCRLAVRDGELWAVDVTWTPDGAQRLRDRRQRYISPIVFCDSETGRAEEIFNLGLVANPATHDAQALVASRRLTLSEGTSMNPEMVKKALDALVAGEAEAAMSILKEMIASAAGGESASDSSGDSGEEATAAAAEPPPMEEEKEEEEALSVALSKSLGTDRTASAIVGEVARLRSEVKALALARSAEEHTERVTLVGELVKLGAELPATAWEDPDKQKPIAWLRDMPIKQLRNRVEAFRASPRAPEVKPPKRDALDITALSESDRIRAEGMTDPAARARYIALRLSRMESVQ